eukprot:m.9067 g.9067  ORF g.9067 m.9067 type:complete len:56 (-) comp5418_c0_seq1:140-307(-)
MQMNKPPILSAVEKHKAHSSLYTGVPLVGATSPSKAAAMVHAVRIQTSTVDHGRG